MNNQMHGFVAAENAPLHDMDLARSSGAANLIDNCLGNVEGMTILLVCEDPRHGWYDSAARTVFIVSYWPAAPRSGG